MNRLRHLRYQLAALRLRRRWVRSGTAWSRFGAGALWVLIAMFLVDWAFSTSVPQRVVLLVAGGSLILWRGARWLRPLAKGHETLTDVALMVESRQGIDSDLVAGLEFERPDPRRRGSRALEEAVVEYVADSQRDLDVMEGFTAGPLWSALAVLIVSLAVPLGAAIAWPGHARAFFERLALGGRHYPTRTVLRRVAVGGFLAWSDQGDRNSVRLARGADAEFTVDASGELPEEGRVWLRPVAGSDETELRLRPRPEQSGVFRARLPRLTDSLEFRVELGDAWTEPERLDVIPLPVVTITWTSRPPDYVRSAVPETRTGARQVEVLQGSSVDLRLTCANKPLRRATLQIGEASLDLTADGSDGRSWILPAEGTPLATVEESLRYEISVSDRDRLDLDSPLRGVIRVVPDREPRVAVEVVTRHVLPAARPVIAWGARDDHGLARVVLRLESVPAEGDPVVVEHPLLAEGVEGAEGDPVPERRGEHAADLSPLRLRRGDRVKVVLVATDGRGDMEGVSAESDPLTLEVTDERGILEAMVEADEESARQLDSIIDRQLGRGRGDR